MGGRIFSGRRRVLSNFKLTHYRAGPRLDLPHRRGTPYAPPQAGPRFGPMAGQHAFGAGP